MCQTGTDAEHDLLQVRDALDQGFIDQTVIPEQRNRHLPFKIRRRDIRTENPFRIQIFQFFPGFDILNFRIIFQEFPFYDRIRIFTVKVFPLGRCIVAFSKKGLPMA